MTIEVTALSACSVSDGGERIALCFVDSSGRPGAVSLSVTDASAIAMTLPHLLRRALRLQTGDEGSVFAFPLDGWRLEGSDGGGLILTLSTDGGFEVSFATEPAALASLGSALSADLPEEAPAAPPRPRRLRN